MNPLFANPSFQLAISRASRSKFKRLGLSLSLAMFCAGRIVAQSDVAGSPPNDATAATYFPYKHTTISNVKYSSYASSCVGDIWLPNYTGKPTPANATSRPAIVVVHGGGGTSGARASTRELQIAGFCADHGFVAFNIDYPIGSVYPHNIQAWRTAVRFLRANAATYGIDTNHIGITGGSFGGFCSGFMSGITNGQHTLKPDSYTAYNNASLDLNSANELASYSGDIQCAIDLYGPMDQTTSGNAGGQYAGTGSTTLYNSSPINYVHVGSAPLMIAHGTSDTTVSISQSTAMIARLTSVGVPNYFAKIQGAAHTFYYYSATQGQWPAGNSALDLRKTAFDWFDKWLLVANNPPSVTSPPQNATGCVGSSASFTVVASGATPLYYQWSGPNGTIAGATSATYTIPTLATSDNGTYTVAISNSVGVASSSATLTVSTSTPASISGQPTNQTVAASSAVNISVVAGGTSLQYQWTKDGVQLVNATNATYSIANATSAHSGVYQVSVYNTCATLLSSNATLVVNAPPAITGQPGSDTICSGDSETFVATATGVAPLTYQWYGPTNHLILGATTNTVTLTNLTAADTGSYYLVASNNYGATTSSVAVLTVSGNSQVSFSTQPADTSAAVGGTATFSFTVNPSAGGSYTYQWFKGDYDPIPDAVSTNATLVFTNVTIADNAYYHCLVSNSCSAIQSANATLTVNYAPIITQQPQAVSTVSGASASFAVAVDGTLPLSFQWTGPAGAISGATNQSFSIASATTNDVGNYSVTITNAFGATNSATAALSIIAGNSYLQEPFNYSSGPLSGAAPWNTGSVSNSTGLVIVSGGLSYPGLAEISPAGNLLQVTPISGATNCYRPFDNKVTNGTVYVSLLGNCTAPVGSSGYGTFGLLPSSTTASGGRTTDPLVLQVKTNTGGGVIFGVGSAGAASAVYATNVAQLNSTTLVVLKYDLSSKQASLYVNPTVGNAEPGSPDATVTGTNTFADLNYVYMRGVAGGGTWSYDTIRIASTWPGALPYAAPIPVAPQITQDPQSQTVLAGTTASFSVVATGSSPLSYQWRRGGTLIGGATTNNYSLTGTTTNDSASTFDVVITNAYGAITSAVATLTVTNIPPTPTQITINPQSQTVIAGANPSFSVLATGSSPLSYQWRRGGAPIGAATNTSYSLVNVTTNDTASTFDVIVANAYGSITSSVATLTVNAQTTAPAELLSIEAGKTIYYSQTNTSAPAIQSGSAGRSWFAEVQGILPAIVTNAAVSFTGSSTPNPHVLPTIDNTGLAQDELFFSSQAALDAAFNNGNYHYVTKFASGNVYTNDIPLGPPDNYPNAPTLTAPAGDWTAGKLALHAVTGGYALA